MADARTGIEAIHHIAISTHDLDRLVEFYERLFGARLVREGGWRSGKNLINERIGLPDSACRIVMLELCDRYLELFEFQIPTQMRRRKPLAHHFGFVHLCFQVSDCWSEYGRLRDLGMEFHAEPLTMPTGATFTYGRDPDDNIIEIVSVPDDCEFPKVGQ